jgi:phytoene dehydrogenase-like protein
MSTRFDAVVVGSGPNGLCAAIAMADAGRSVLVREAAETLGGGCRTDQRTLPGFHHDACSAIHPMAAASPFLRALPLEEHGLEWVHPDLPFAHPMDDGPAAFAARDLAETADALDDDGPRYRRLFSPFVDRFDALLEDALGPLPLVPSHPVLLARFGLKAFRAADALARASFRGPRARALFAGAAAHSVLPLDDAPSAAVGLMLQSAAHAGGWPFPRGGAGALADALVSLARARGVELEAGRPVTSLDELPTDGPVLFDTGPRALAAIAGDALPASYARAAERFRYGPGLCKVDYALDEPIPWRDEACRRAATVHVGGTLEELVAAERAPWRGEVAERPFLIVTQCSPFDDSRAPEGKHTAWAYAHVPSGSDVDVTEAIERQIDRFAPGFRDVVLARATTTAAGLEAYNPNYIGGDVNGGAATLGQLFTRPVRRLVPYRTPNPRLFLCSASTPPGGGVHGMCGVHAARVALQQQ